MGEEPKPCPFCGGDWVSINVPANPRVAKAVKCRSCNASGPVDAAKQSDDEIVAAWNTRPASPADVVDERPWQTWTPSDIPPGVEMKLRDGRVVWSFYDDVEWCAIPDEPESEVVAFRFCKSLSHPENARG